MKHLKRYEDFIINEFNNPFNLNGNYYFLRWTSSPENDVLRNFSGHLQCWVDTEEDAWEARNDEIENEDREFLHEPREDPVSGLWNYDPEWGISGYCFKDELSFNEAMSNIKEIAWHHKDINRQKLCLFIAKEMGDEEGYDGEDLLRNLTFIDYVNDTDSYKQVMTKISNKVNENFNEKEDVEKWMTGECIPFAVALTHIFPEYKIAVINDLKDDSDWEDDDDDELEIEEKPKYDYNFVHAFCYHPRNHKIIIDARGIRALDDLYQYYHDINPSVDWDIPNAQFLIDEYAGKEFHSEESFDYDEQEFEEAKEFIMSHKEQYSV